MPEAPRVSPRCFAHLSVWRRSRYTIAMTDGLILHPDNKTRCWWPGTDPFYVAYHDTEWGVPEFDDRALFEKLILDGFQAGLSWITILRKRENFRRAFAGFDPAVIARFDDAQVETLMLDQGSSAIARRSLARSRAPVRGWPFRSGAASRIILWEHRRRAAGPEQRENRASTSGLKLTCLGRSPRRSRPRASISSDRQSSTRSCRRSAWSTITSPAASVTQNARPLPRNCDGQGTARLAADALREAARPPQSLASRCGARRHRPRACPRRALERTDDRLAHLLRGAAQPACRSRSRITWIRP